MTYIRLKVNNKIQNFPIKELLIDESLVELDGLIVKLNLSGYPEIKDVFKIIEDNKMIKNLKHRIMELEKTVSHLKKGVDSSGSQSETKEGSQETSES